MDDVFHTLTTLSDHPSTSYYSLPSLEKALGISLSRLPISIRIMLESLCETAMKYE